MKPVSRSPELVEGKRVCEVRIRRDHRWAVALRYGGLAAYCGGVIRSAFWRVKRAPVAQLDRASDFGSEGWGFKSLRARPRNPIKSKIYCHFGGDRPQSGSSKKT